MAAKHPPAGEKKKARDMNSHQWLYSYAGVNAAKNAPHFLCGNDWSARPVQAALAAVLYAQSLLDDLDVVVVELEAK